MSERSDSAPTHPALALYTDELLRRPGVMAAVRELVEQYRDGEERGEFRPVCECLPFVEDFDPRQWGFLVRKEGGYEPAKFHEPVPFTKLRPEQTAAAVAAHHDSFCEGVELVVMPDPVTPAGDWWADPDRARRIKRGVAWAAHVRVIRDQCDGDGAADALHWFKLQVRTLKEVVAERLRPAGPPPNPRGRPRKHDAAKDQTFVNDWKRAKAAGVEFKEFCKDKGMTSVIGDQIKSRVRRRKNTGGKGVK